MKVRTLIALAVLVSGAVHLQQWFAGFRTIAVIGPAFLVNAGAALVITVLLLSWRHWVPLLLALGFGVATLAAYLTSATVGLFGVHEVWTSGPVILAGVAEIVIIVASAAVLWKAYGPDSAVQSRRPSTATHPLHDR